MKGLVETLNRAVRSGDSWADGEAAEMPKMLGLEVKRFGPVSLPLVDPQASELIKMCKRAPYGRNTHTLVDRAVRDSYQLDPDQVSITNPEWKVKLERLVAHVAQTLGCQAPIEVDRRYHS